jgi:sugar phosphate isomerase/epimerase
MAGIALQLYTMREPAKEDLLGTLKRVREIGWEYVQWSGMPDLPAEKIRDTLDAAGLKAVAAHCRIEPFEKDFNASVAVWKTVGAGDVAPGGMMGDCRDSIEAWLSGAKRLDALGGKLNKAGLRLSYHNHDFEFGTFEGNPNRKIDLLYETASPENLYCELDTAWVQVGGADPASYLRKYSGRCPVIHVKDLAPEKRNGRVWFTPLGEGVLDWTEIFRAGAEAKVEWYVYEQDTCEGDPIDSARISFKFLDKNVK